VGGRELALSPGVEGELILGEGAGAPATAGITHSVIAKNPCPPWPLKLVKDYRGREIKPFVTQCLINDN